MEIRFLRPCVLDKLSCVAKVVESRSELTMNRRYFRPNRPTAIRTILVVDDCQFVIDNLCGRLRSGLNFVGMHGIRQEKHNIGQVMAFIAQLAPNMIIMDYEMPGAKGDILISMLREVRYGGWIIANSGSEDANLLMMQAGADIKMTSLSSAKGMLDLFE